MKLLVATRNRGKLRELEALLGPHGVQVLGLADLDGVPEVEEDGDTFLANARKKARTLADATGLPALADDSGLAVEALGGRPGVWSARYAGPAATDADNNRKLLAELAGVPPGERGAAFECALVLALPGGGERTAAGRLSGRILAEPRGTGGFGYDPLFAVDGPDLTLAELSLEAKNRLSHRARALARLVPAILELARSERPPGPEAP
ncbi:MAG: XTP/dITP diphosphatase [Deferrisomatales bacterium]